MKKTLIASAIASSFLISVDANAFHLNNISVTNMLFGTTNYAAGGTLNAAGTGTMASVDPFFYHTWTGTQATGFMDTSGSFAGSNNQGAWDYSTEINAMSAGQIAVGFFFNWNSQNGIAVLEIFDCEFNICTGNGVAMGNGPLYGSVGIFSGTTLIPVPAAVWLMGSGLIGLVSVGRLKRKKV